MEWKSNLWRTQSLSSIQSPYDKPTWIEAGWQDKKASVSQLVARYQTAAEVRTSIQANSINTSETKPQQVLKQDTHRQQLMRRNDERERSQAKTNLSRSKSMGSLQNSTGSIEVLRALFESKATMQNKVKSSFRTTKFTSPYKAADMPVINREGEELKNTAEEPKNKIPADASVNTAKTAAKEDHVTRKVVNQTRAARRKTIGGIDFERIAASQNDEKRRSLADFRDSSFLQTKEKLYVSVKAMSALYLSKVAPQEPNRPLKPAQDQSSESGKKVKLSKMAEDSQERQDDFPPPPSARHQPGPEDVSGAHSQQCMPSQLSREKLYQQRQKCELRRLLKHTHPELKMLGEAVDEEFAEVLSSEAGVTAGETGYEGEVLSRCLIFENCALSNKVSPYNPKMCTAEGTAETRDASKQSAVSEKQEERLCNESVTGIVEDDKMLGSSPYSNREEEEKIRIDVQATRRIFESQAVNTSRVNPNEKFQGKVSISGDETGAVPKQKQQFEMCSQNDQHSKNISSDTDVAKQPHKHGSCAHVVGQSINRDFSGREEASTGETGFEDDPTSLLSPEGFEEMIKTSADLFNNNPFISTNIERENSHVHKSMPQIQANPNGSSEDSLITNVKNRAHLFESMPFDKIRHQNQDEIETMVENIKETLNSLYLANAIHSNGSIIEVNETMIAKKAKFSLSENGPKIKYDEVAEGGTQNFIFQLLPRANLKPQITYLKEDSKGRMEVTVINVPLHHHQFITSQDTQFKTANVVQLVEDILNQDNSLRKGVIIEEDENNSAEIIVYSLYNYFDEENVKSYCPPQGHGAECDKPETDRIVMSKTKNQGVRKDVKSETSQDQTCSGSIRPEEKGNVKLFTSCIEKGDLEYLKTLQAVPAVLEQEPPLSQTVVGQGTKPLHEQRGDQAEDSSAEWAPVDVKRLKCLFSGHQRQTQAKQNCHEKHGQSVTVSKAITGQNVPLEKNQSSTECNVGVFAKSQVKTTFREEGNSATIPQGSYLHLETQDCDTVQQAELVETVDDNDEISCLQTAIHSLKQATGKVKSLPHSSQNKQSVQASEELEEPPVSVTADDLKHSRTEAELPQGNEDEKVDSCTELRLDPSTSCCTSKHKTELQHENIEIHPEETNSEKVQTTQTGSMNGQKGVDVVQEYCEDVVHCSEMTSDQQEEILQGKLKAALQSLERSNMNVTRGDFRAAMIYRNASKPCKKSSQNVGAVSVQKSTMEVFCPVTETTSTQVPLRQELPKGEVTATNAEPQSQREALNRPGVSEKTKSPTGSKPTIPPKPEHLKVKQRDSQSDSTKKPKATQMATLRPEVKMLSKDKTFPQPAKSVLYMDEFMKEPSKINRGSDSGLGSKTEAMSPESQIRPLNKNVFNHSEMKNAEEIGPQNFPVQDNTTDTDESHINFHEACQKFGGKKKNAPVKPKEIKTAQSDTKNLKNTHGDNNSPISTHVDTKPRQTLTDPLFSTCEHTADINERHKKESKQENKVEMREKKGRTETEDERRQRLSVHMDEIMRGNITAAMEIMDNLRKQEELQGILSQVEQIEQDTSKADVRSLRTVRENMSDWVVSSNIEKQRKVQVEPREKLTKDITESKSAMAHVFVDLERASEEIMNLKEQTLARLMDIEEAIKKALYSVSTLKSDSDIAGLSRLFKESLGAVKKSPPSGNISKISIGSNRTKPPQAQESPDMKKIKSLSAGQGAGTETVSGNQPASPPSSPAFISIYSAARKTERMPAETAICPTCQHNLKTEEKFRTTKTLTCHNPALNRNSDPRKEGQKQSTYRAKQNPFVGGTD